MNLLLLWALGCGAPTPADTPIAATACTADQALQSTPRICMNVPTGFQVRAGAGSTLSVTDPANPGTAVVLKWMPDPGGTFFDDQVKATLQGADHDAASTRGPTPDGHGTWVRYDLATTKVGPTGHEESVRRYGTSVARASGFVVWCRAEVPHNVDLPDGLLEACATLQVGPMRG